VTDTGIAALRDLRRARRRRAYGTIDWWDAIYRVYVTAILSALGTSIVSGWIGGRPVSSHELAQALAHGPAVVGLLVAAAIAVGLRAGGRGGPLVISPADVNILLMAPLPRSVVLRGPATRQLRFSGFVGAVLGMIVGNLAAQRLPGTYAAWVASCGLAGAIAGLAFTGAALVASGLRSGRRVAAGLAVAVVGWSGADLLAGAATSPATYLGRLALAPLHGLRAPALGATLLALPLAGLAVVGRTSLEAARRQSGLLAQLRFAVTMQDVRTVILLRRQLAAEGPRGHPWLRLSPGGRLAAMPVWRRDWQGILRWPAVRVVRVLGLGALGGVAAFAAWRGTPALIVVAAAALQVAALDAVEGLAQEADHPTRSSMLPVTGGWLVTRHLAAPAVVLLAVAAIGVVVAGGLGIGSPLGTAAVGLVIAIPAAATAVVGAALSIDIGPANPLDTIPTVANLKLAVRVAGPLALAIAGVLPVLAAQAASDGGRSAVLGAAPAAIVVLMVAAAVGSWLGRAS
jgi:hypothetical protein